MAAEGVSLFPQAVTRQMVANFWPAAARHQRPGRHRRIDLRVVDAGCLASPSRPIPASPGRARGSGTANLAAEAAMRRETCEKALLLGAALAGQAAAEGSWPLARATLGIANTTPSTALFCAYLGLAPQAITGPGTGLTPPACAARPAWWPRPCACTRAVLASGDPVAILAALGGLEIACLAGLILGAAARKLPIAVDGFISTAAYVAARAIAPAVADYAFVSHASAEPGYAAVADALGQKPLLDLGLRLGEGTGAVLRCSSCGGRTSQQMASSPRGVDGGASGRRFPETRGARTASGAGT